jgi:TRAP-type C4-dicarboxylate transport system permease small subunit
MHSLAAWLRRRAENVAAAMLAVMFAAFIIQIVFRYFFNFPIGWAAELSVVMWLWLVLWGAAFVLRDEEEIRFDLLSASAGRRARIVMGIVSSLALVVLYGASLPATYSYVTFMKVEKASYLKVRMDWLFSIYLLFLVAILARYLWKLSYLVRGREPRQADPMQASSGL